VDEVIKLIFKHGFKEEKAILLVDSPFDILRMVEKGVSIDCVNVGGIHSKQGRKKILPYLYLSTEEVSAFKKLLFLGIRCECRDVPLAKKKNLSNLLVGLKL
jgi:mannose/fructose/N-acetylgalactosamine-specific phosphotransferase system component IIB